MNYRYKLAFLALGFFATGNAFGIQLGQLDDFEAAPSQCSTDGWTEGFSSTNPPVGQLLCGELDTCCLSAESAGGFGPGSSQTVFNEAQWTGDYLAAGVNRIQLQAANASAIETLHLRVGISGADSCYVSTNAVTLPPGAPGSAGLEFISFYLDESAMTSVTGNLCPGPGVNSLQDALANVIQLRIISSAEPAWSGDDIVSTLHLDAIQAKSDTDLDGVNDDLDNCTALSNPDQRDTDADGYGNLCDPDFNNDCMINFSDLGDMRAVFFTADADADLNGDGTVSFIDLAIVRDAFFGEPGPGLGACGACVPAEELGANSDFAGLQMFMRGGLVMDWGAQPGVNNFSDQTGGLYIARFEAGQGTYEWKIADAGWSIEYCTTTSLVQNTGTTAPLFGCAFPANGTIEVPSSGCYEFQMQTDGNVPPNEVNLIFSPDSQRGVGKR